ncbi:MAG: hypothetical protein U1E76_01785 [Planctomycetota bacterium]
MDELEPDQWRQEIDDDDWDDDDADGDDDWHYPFTPADEPGDPFEPPNEPHGPGPGLPPRPYEPEVDPEGDPG